MGNFRKGRQSLPVQMVVTLVALVILTAAAIGLPAIRTMRVQFDRQAGETLAQGSRTAAALLQTEESELERLALLIAQRPTLLSLIQRGDPVELLRYLESLQAGAGLDLILLCDSAAKPVVQAGKDIDDSVCATVRTNEVSFWEDPSRPAGWLLSSQPVDNGPGVAFVVVGRALDGEFSSSLRDRIGMEVVLVSNGKFLSTSLANSTEAQEAAAEILSGQDRRQGQTEKADSLFTLGNIPNYFTLSNEQNPALSAIIFFPAQDISHAQRDLTWVAGGGILLVILLGSAIGVFRARQISQPLERLRDAAEGLRKGDLDTPIVVRTNVQEVAQVATALEDARRALQYSLNQLRDEKAWVDHLLESIVEGILTIDRRGRINYFSKGAERITGWTSREAIGKGLDDVFHIPADDARFSKLIPAPGARQKMVVQLKDSRQITLAVTGAQMAPPGSGKASTVLVLRDVSDEEVIRRLLGEFLANISHEFRTPLTALAASIELLLDQLPDLSPDELRELLGATHLGVLNLQTLIDNLLEGASLETGHFRVHPRFADFSEIVLEAAAAMTPLAHKYGQEIRLDLDEGLPKVMIDTRRMSQVLANLVSNAVKWGPPGGTIQISAVMKEAEICVSISDEGPGIPEHSMEDLFRRFDRAQAPASRGEYGAGLGLSVVKAIIEAHGGRVGVQNREVGGASFWFTLPLITAAEKEKETEV